MILYNIIKNYLTSVKTKLYHVCFEQELRSLKILHEACVPQGAIFLW